jgi:hypothetical protein
MPDGDQHMSTSRIRCRGSDRRQALLRPTTLLSAVFARSARLRAAARRRRGRARFWSRPTSVTSGARPPDAARQWSTPCRFRSGTQPGRPLRLASAGIRRRSPPITDKTGVVPVGQYRVRVTFAVGDRRPGLVPVLVSRLAPTGGTESPYLASRFRVKPVFGEQIDWETLGVEPRWLGQDTSECAAAFDPSTYHNQGADELHRFLAGAKVRSETHCWSPQSACWTTIRHQH